MFAKIASLLCLLTFYAASADQYDVNPWVVGISYNFEGAEVGDTVVFTYGSPHDVKIYPSGVCDDATGAISVGATGAGTATYTITSADAGKSLFFVCTVSGHCAAGQTTTVKVDAADPTEAPAADPTEAPAADPSEAPASSPNEDPAGSPSDAPAGSPAAPTSAPPASDANTLPLAKLVVMLGTAAAAYFM